MKVLIGFFTTESNANIRQKATLADYDLAWGGRLPAKKQSQRRF